MRVLIVDDHEVVRRGVRSLLQSHCEVCGEAVDGQDAIEKARQLKPDVVVMDVSMPNLNGLEATPLIRNILPDCEILILSQHESAQMVRQAFKAGARGYVVKSSAARDLPAALETISKHESFFDPAVLGMADRSGNLDAHEILQRSVALERALRESEELYRSTFELTAVGVAHVNPDGRWLRVNKKLCEILGYSETELMKLTFQNITHPEDLTRDLEEFEKVKAGVSDRYSIEKRYLRKDGTTIWINLAVSGVRDSSGKLKHFISVVEDINERRILERVGATLASELDLKKVVQVATDAGRELSGAGFGAFFYNVLDDKGESYMLYTLSGAAPEDFSKFPMPRNTRIFAPTFTGDRTLRLDDVTKDHRYGKNPPYHGMPPGHLPVRSYLAVPVKSRTGEVLGGLFYGHPEAGVFTERAEQLVEGLAKHAAIAIDNARLYERATSTRTEADASAERLRLAQQVANVGTFEWNIKTGVSRWTPELEKIHGLPPGGFAGTKPAWEQLVHPDDREKALRRVELAMKEGTFEGEWRVVWPDGSVHWLLGRGSVLKDETGAPERLVGVNIDVTERKGLEEALHEEQSKLALALESSRTAIFDWDVVQNRGSWNPQMAAIYDFSPAADYITAMEWRALFHPDDATRLAGEAHQILTDRKREKFHFEFRNVREGGEIRWILSHGRIVRDANGNALRMIGTHTDITDQKRVEQNLQRRQAELNEAQRLAKIGSWRWTPETGTVIWSEELYRIAGRDLNSRSFSYHDHSTIYTRDSWTRLRAAVDQALKKQTPYSLELELLRPDGTKRWVITNGEAECDGRGDVIALRGTVQDITDRKQIERELRDSEERTRFSLEAANVGTWEWNVKTGEIHWSSNMEAVHGQAAGSFGSSFESFLEGVFTEDREKVKEQIQLALSGDGKYHVEYRQYRSDGSLGWMESTGTVVFDADGQPMRMFGICSNVTERKDAEGALKDSESRLRAAFGQSYSFFVLLEADGTIVEVNRAAMEAAGSTREQLIGRKFWEPWWSPLPEEVQVLRDAIAKAAGGTPVRDECCFCLSDGTRRFADRSLSPVLDDRGNVSIIVATALDITERKQAEKALRESEQRLRVVTDATPIMVWMSGTDKLCYYFNKSWLDFVGRTLEQESGNGWAENVHPDDFDRCLQIYVSSFEARLSFKMEYRMRHHTGQYRWIIDCGVPRYTPDGTFEGYVGGCLDMHDQKEAAEKVRIADEAMRLMKIQDQERRHIARELHDSAGQTLAVLGMSLARLVQRTDAVSPELAKTGKEIEEIVQQLSREIRTTSYLLHPPLLDECGLASTLKAYVQGIVERSGLLIDVSIPDDLGRLPPDMELAIFRIVQECLTNIHRHSGSKTASIQVDRRAGSICVEVRDGGKGISPERLNEIQSGGAGVGIRGIRERLRHLHAEMRIESNSSGTCISADIPLPKDAQLTDIQPLQEV